MKAFNKMKRPKHEKISRIGIVYGNKAHGEKGEHPGFNFKCVYFTAKSKSYAWNKIILRNGMPWTIVCRPSDYDELSNSLILRGIDMRAKANIKIKEKSNK